MFSAVLGEVGLPGVPYDVVATRLALTTGGFNGFCESAIPIHEASDAERRLILRVKTLESTLPEAVDLVTQLLQEASLDNVDRLADLIKEARSDISASVLPAGNSFATLRATRWFSHAVQFDEAWRGADQLLFLSASNDADRFSDALQTIRAQVLRRDNLVLNVTADPDRRSVWEEQVARLAASLPPGGFGTEAAVTDLPEPVNAEALIVSSDVSYVAMAMHGARYGSPEHVHEQVLAHLLRTGHLWETVRMKGGAYGANAAAHGLDGVFSFSSYRDPRIEETLNAYRESLELMATGDIPDDELDLAIIGVTGHHIRPMSPAQKAIISLRRVLYGITDEMRAANHATLLATTGRSVREAADRLRQSMAQSCIAVVGGRNAVDAAATAVPGLGDHRVDLPV
jgi:hypothetical protein